MDPQLQNLLISAAIGFVAFIVIRNVFKLIGLVFNLILLGGIVVVVYLVISGGA